MQYDVSSGDDRDSVDVEEMVNVDARGANDTTDRDFASRIREEQRRLREQVPRRETFDEITAGMSRDNMPIMGGARASATNMLGQPTRQEPRYASTWHVEGAPVESEREKQQVGPDERMSSTMEHFGMFNAALVQASQEISEGEEDDQRASGRMSEEAPDAVAAAGAECMEWLDTMVEDWPRQQGAATLQRVTGNAAVTRGMDVEGCWEELTRYVVEVVTTSGYRHILALLDRMKETATYEMRRAASERRAARRTPATVQTTWDPAQRRTRASAAVASQQRSLDFSGERTEPLGNSQLDRNSNISGTGLGVNKRGPGDRDAEDIIGGPSKMVPERGQSSLSASRDASRHTPGLVGTQSERLSNISTLGEGTYIGRRRQHLEPLASQTVTAGRDGNSSSASVESSSTEGVLGRGGRRDEMSTVIPPRRSAWEEVTPHSAFGGDLIREGISWQSWFELESSAREEGEPWTRAERSSSRGPTITSGVSRVRRPGPFTARSVEQDISRTPSPPIEQWAGASRRSPGLAESTYQDRARGARVMGKATDVGRGGTDRHGTRSVPLEAPSRRVSTPIQEMSERRDFSDFFSEGEDRSDSFSQRGLDLQELGVRRDEGGLRGEAQERVRALSGRVTSISGEVKRIPSMGASRGVWTRWQQGQRRREEELIGMLSQRIGMNHEDCEWRAAELMAQWERLWEIPTVILENEALYNRLVPPSLRPTPAGTRSFRKCMEAKERAWLEVVTVGDLGMEGHEFQDAEDFAVRARRRIDRPVGRELVLVYRGTLVNYPAPWERGRYMLQARAADRNGNGGVMIDGEPFAGESMGTLTRMNSNLAAARYGNADEVALPERCRNNFVMHMDYV